MESARLMQAGQGEEPHLRTEENKKILKASREGTGEKRNHLGKKTSHLTLAISSLTMAAKKQGHRPFLQSSEEQQVVYIADIAG